MNITRLYQLYIQVSESEKLTREYHSQR